MTITQRPPIRRSAQVLAAMLIAIFLTAVPAPAQAGDEAISVDFGGVSGGAPTYRASGWIYGMTENGSGPADHFFRDVRFRYMRAGGAQLGSPGGWVSGSYDRRWNATLAQARRTIALGGQFIILPHDLWGADGYPISRFPGDNGNWSDYDAFLTRLINDVRAAGITVQWDIWNEPNLSLFWNRPQAQYLELWRRSYQRIRAAFPGQLIVGPSCACVPSTTHAFWNAYLDFARANNVIPDIVSWHSLPGDPWPTWPPRTPRSTRAAFRTRARTRSTSTGPGTSRTRATEPGTSPGWSGPAPTGCARTGPAPATCTTTWATCSYGTPRAGTCPRANGGSTASTPPRPVRSCR
ncbi:hypothetical protein AB0I81_61970 [Nonomuraea sp. NPDC050404]|uniref:GH39 family glycosyl hydrolase n=1 Tax=Nonomuraea sp. NPDC050404 TaxID=3155783 RepID=UPI0034093151